MLLEVQNIKELNYLEHVVNSLKEYGYQVTFLEEKIKGLKEEYEEKRESFKEKVEQRISLTTENSNTKEQEFMIKLHLLRQEMNKPILLLDFLESTESFETTESDKKLFERLGDAYLESLLELQDSIIKKEEIIRRYYDLVLKKMLTMYQENTLENKEELKENHFLRDSILRYLKEKGVMIDNISYHSVKETLDSYLKEEEEIEVTCPPVVAIDREKVKLSMIESFFYKIGDFFSRLFSDEEEDALFLEKKKEDASFFTILSEEDYNNLHLSGIMNAISSSYAKYLGVEQNSYLMNTLLSDGVLCNSNGLFVLCPLQDKTVGCRIAIPIDKMPIENIENAKLREDGILEIEYGYYPKEEIPSNVDVSIRKERIDRRLIEIWRSEDRRKTLYQNQGNLYLECSFENAPYTSRFFTIEPQKWYYRRGDRYAISKDIVFGGIPFEEKGYFNGSFQKTTIKKYLDTTFWEDFKRYTFYYDKYKTIEETCNLPSFDLLTKEQIENLKVFQSKGKYANKTDYATLCGNESPAYYLKDQSIISKDEDDYYLLRKNIFLGEEQKYCGYRPICSLSQIPKEVLEHGEKDSDDIMTIDYLEGPQHIVKNTAESLILDFHYEKNQLRKTGRKYKRYEKEDDIEYSYGGKKYVRMKIQEPPLMRTKERGKTVGDYVFVQVEPYKWYVDETLKIAIAKDILLSDIPFKLMTSNNFGTDFLIPKEEAKVYQKSRKKEAK